MDQADSTGYTKTVEVGHIFQRLFFKSRHVSVRIRTGFDLCNEFESIRNHLRGPAKTDALNPSPNDDLFSEFDQKDTSFRVEDLDRKVMKTSSSLLSPQSILV